jgi:hypothetical protein
VPATLSVVAKIQFFKCGVGTDAQQFVLSHNRWANLCASLANAKGLAGIHPLGWLEI